jgi:hypothetical protein
MASGINSTFRQVAIATSIAALGSIFNTKLRSAPAGQHAAAFVGGINELLLISGLLALVTGVLALLLIRQRDFVAYAPAEPSEAASVSA